MSKKEGRQLNELLLDIDSCSHCQKDLPLGPRPVVSAHIESKIVIVGQAPGTAVHVSGIPWDDKSGENLRAWLGVDKNEFYDPRNFAIIPMGFCYPGKGKSGDLPPRHECAPLWHESLMDKLEKVELILLIGKYAQDYYLPAVKKLTLTEKVRRFRDFLPEFMVLPHPSPRNNIWQAKNEWFKHEVLPELKLQIRSIL